MVTSDGHGGGTQNLAKDEHPARVDECLGEFEMQVDHIASQGDLAAQQSVRLDRLRGLRLGLEGACKNDPGCRRESVSREIRCRTRQFPPDQVCGLVCGHSDVRGQTPFNSAA